jgi:hypothetical protein
MQDVTTNSPRQGVKRLAEDSLDSEQHLAKRLSLLRIGNLLFSLIKLFTQIVCRAQWQSRNARSCRETKYHPATAE